MGIYRKMHIPDDPLYYEKFYFTPGDTGFRAWKTQLRATSACWSAGISGIPEAARLTALQGAEILFYPTAIGWHPSEKKQYGEAQHESWEVIQRSHAVANGCYVCAPEQNRPRAGARSDGRPVSADGIAVLGAVVRRRSRRAGGDARERRRVKR